MKPIHTYLKCNRRQQGVTLVELMIAVVISSIVLIGVGTVYITSKRAYLVQEEYGRMQENARFAFDFLTRDIRQAGYAGCNPSINNLLNTSAGNADLFDFANAIYGWEYNNTGPGDSFAITTSAPAPSSDAGDWSDHNGRDLHGTIAGNAMAGSDVIVVKSAREIPNLIPDSNTPPGASAISFSGATGVKQGEIVMLSDCRKADVFMNGNTASATSLNRPNGCGGFTPCNVNPSSANFSHQYKDTDSRIIRTTSRAYFIGRGASGQPALFRIDYDQGTGAANAQELVEGVENMQILYGEDLTPNNGSFEANQYVTFDNVSNLSNVVSVRISLLMRTGAELDRPADTNTYHLLSVDDTLDMDVDPENDRRLRKVFTTTIAVRNKMINNRGI
jgi:type IV pilus assembly protein PilW